MHAIRLRALIEAGRGADEKAEWWWHAGLNLQSEGSDSVFGLVDDEIAAKLRTIKVRPSRPPEKSARPKPGRDSQRPAAQALLSSAWRIKDYEAKSFSRSRSAPAEASGNLS